MRLMMSTALPAETGAMICTGLDG